MPNLPFIDPWGTPYVVRCYDADTKVLSLGGDKKETTADAIVEPQ